MSRIVFCIAALLTQNIIRRARHTCIEHQQARLELCFGFTGTDYWIDEDSIVRIEANVLQPAICGDVLILFADRLLTLPNLDVTCFAGETLGTDVPAGVRI